MTAAADTLEETTLMGLHAIYPDRRYGIALVGDYLMVFDETWLKCNSLTYQRFAGHEAFGLIEPVGLDKPLGFANLGFARLHIESPMDLTVVAQGGWAAVTAYAIHLFVRILRNPESVGAWLPRLVAGWHQGWQEAGETKRTRKVVARDLTRTEEVVGALIEGTERLASTELKPNKVTALGAGEPPEDLANIDQE